MALLAGAFIGSLVAAALRSQPPLLMVIFPPANILEVLVASWVLHRLGGISGAFERVADVVAFTIACVIAPLVSATISAFGLSITAGVPFWLAWKDWYVAGALSLGLVTPVLVVCLRLVDRPRDRLPTAAHVAEIALVLGLVTAAATLTFSFGRLPLLFVILPFVLLAAFRLRQFGATAAVVIVAVVATVATINDLGPIASAGVDHAGRLLLLQFFLIVLFVTALPVAAALAERDARANEASLLADHFKTVVENIDEVIFRTDRQGRWTYLNPAWEGLSGYSVAESLGRSWTDTIPPEDHAEFAEWAKPVFAGEVQASRRMMRFRTGRGETRWMEFSVQGLLHRTGHIVGATGTVRDIDDRKRLEDYVMTAKRRAEEQAREATLLASTDELTGLANRRAFLRHLNRQVEAANEFGWNLAVAIFDVDHFKGVNDAHGHAVGDRVLQLVAARAVNLVRSGDLVGRLGGEEFGILMPGANSDDATMVAERLRHAIFAGDGRPEPEVLPTVTVSIGLAAHAVGQTAAEMLASADRALYAAKGAGRNRVRLAA